MKKIHHREGTIELYAVISATLKEYEQKVTDEVRENVLKVAKEMVDELRENSPKRSGDYAKGWKSKVTKDKEFEFEASVYNARKPGLTQVLEFGHVIMNGTRRVLGEVEGIEHIYPAREHAEDKLTKGTKVSIQRIEV